MAFFAVALAAAPELGVFSATSPKFFEVPALRHPRGVYAAEVQTPPILKSQHIRVIVEDASKGRIELKGLVNLNGTFAYWVDDAVKTWQCEFSSNTLRELQRWKCNVGGFSYDARRNEAHLELSLPMRRIGVTLRSVCR